MNPLSDRINNLAVSQTLAMAALARELKAQGKDIISLSLGEPDFNTPEFIKEAAKKAIDENYSTYTPVEGYLELKEAICKKFKRDNNLEYKPSQIVVSTGAKQSLYNIAQVMLNDGDEVILPAPYWVSYFEIIKLSGGVPVEVPTSVESDFKITPEQLEAAITPKTKMMWFSSPCNPSGSVYNREELTALAKVLEKHPHVFVVSDEIYEKIIYDDAQHVSIGSLGQEIFDRTIISSGFAKAYAMTGWRVGYLAGPIELIKATSIVQGHSTSNVCTFAQYGAIAALESSQESVEKMRLAFADRREVIFQLLDAIPRISCIKPDGAFYMFVNISKTGMNSLQFCDALLEQQQVAVIPGIAFGADDHIRLSYATDLGTIKKALERLDKFVRHI